MFSSDGNTEDPGETQTWGGVGQCDNGPGRDLGYGQGSGAPFYSQQWFTLCT